MSGACRAVDPHSTRSQLVDASTAPAAAPAERDEHGLDAGEGVADAEAEHAVSRLFDASIPSSEGEPCAPGHRFGCMAANSGIAPMGARPGDALGDFPATHRVCGCIPYCKRMERVIALTTGQHWPQGAEKGNFLCSKAGLP